MAESERSRRDFCDILNSIDRKYEIIHVKWTESKLFEIKFRTQIQRDSDDFNALCDEWVDLFSDVTNTVWAKKISNTGPKIRFRKQYQCWTQGGKIVQKELLFDSRKCKATLDMKVLTDNPLTRRKNKHIKMGLNVVVKINFNHLHRVDTEQPFSFFVHNCEKQPEAPKPAIQPNEKLPQIIADIVQKGLNNCIHNMNSEILPTDKSPPTHTTLSQDLLQNSILDNSLQDKCDQLLQDNLQLPSLNQQTIQLVQNMEMEGVKLEIQPSVQQYTQVVVTSPQIDLTEPLFMYQPLMFDTSAVIPVSTQCLPSHFVQLHSHNLHNHQGQFL